MLDLTLWILPALDSRTLDFCALDSAYFWILSALDLLALDSAL